MAERAKIEFVPVDPASLPDNLKALWVPLAKALAAEKAAKDEFETAFIVASNKAKKIPAGKRLVFGYKYGGVAVGLADDGGQKPAKGKSWF